ncbi:uncharacterized protein LOC141696478 [Apium graveolens]|uniref:uncharacterized protein LOC141696478 n=1 Tax=Apium graveolens TaxID=4045 RepID=UPI003D79E661
MTLLIYPKGQISGMRIPSIKRFQLDDLFDAWQLRVCISLSLFLQIFLIVAGTFRRLASHHWIVLIKMNGDALSHLQVLQYAFVYFTEFKGLVVDLVLRIDERNQSREFFLATSFEVSFRLVGVELNYHYDVLFTEILVQSKFTDSRWAESLSIISLIHYCLHRSSKGTESFYDYFGLQSFLNGIWYVKPHPLTLYIIEFIFNELRMKSEIAKKICSSKGEWILENEGKWILLLWHIATEICYNSNQDQITTNLEQRDTAKQLSDYMLYLMVMKPDMMSAVSTIGDLKFRNTCTERNFFFFGRESEKKKEILQRRACERLFSINGEVKPVTVQTIRNELLLFNASALAKELKILYPSDKKWYKLGSGIS